ncbi:MAG: iron transporter [Nitrospinota bacterium]
MRKDLYPWFGVVVAMLALTVWAFAGEIEIGEAKLRHGMKIEAVYIQPVIMEPMNGIAGMGQSRNKADIHLEADIKAAKHNPWGFDEGSWVPYLTVIYRWRRVETGETGWGLFGSMVADDGPHYGANVKLAGVGRYRLTYRVEPPSLARHTDKETGVPAWFGPFDVSWEFTFLGFGKKGGY